MQALAETNLQGSEKEKWEAGGEGADSLLCFNLVTASPNAAETEKESLWMLGAELSV